MHSSLVSSLVLLCLLLVSTTQALPLRRRGVSISLESETAFCSFLPPHPGNDVGGTEEDGKPFCTSSGLGGETFPTGFIQSAHFVQKDEYVQVTGRMDPDAYQLSHSDGGGQYDNSKFIQEIYIYIHTHSFTHTSLALYIEDISGVTCNGYRYWVNMLEPDNGQYCIRCCKSQSDCNLGQSKLQYQTLYLLSKTHLSFFYYIGEYGCQTIIPGNYD